MRHRHCTRKSGPSGRPLRGPPMCQLRGGASGGEGGGPEGSRSATMTRCKPSSSSAKCRSTSAPMGQAQHARRPDHCMISGTGFGEAEKETVSACEPCIPAWQSAAPGRQGPIPATERLIRQTNRMPANLRDLSLNSVPIGNIVTRTRKNVQ